MDNQNKLNEIYRHIGGLESKVETLQSASEDHGRRITVLDTTMTNVLEELKKTNSSLDSMKENLSGLNELADIKNHVMQVGTVLSGAFRVIKYGTLVGGLGAAAYSSYKAGDIGSFIAYIKEAVGVVF